MASRISSWCFLIFLISWGWYAYSLEYPGEWYRSLASALLDGLGALCFFLFAVVCDLCTQNMKNRNMRFFMRGLELIFLTIFIYMLYAEPLKGNTKIPDPRIGFLFLSFAIVGLCLVRKTIYRSFERPLLGGLNGVSILDELKLFKEGKFQEDRACFMMLLTLLIMIGIILYFKYFR